MKNINRSTIVAITNIYMLMASIVLCVDLHLKKKYLGLHDTNIFSYIVLCLALLLGIAVLILSWESKQMKYEDENKGYFCWLASFIVSTYLFYKTMINFKYIWMLVWFAIIYIIEVIYLQKKLNLKKQSELVNVDITKDDYLMTLCVLNGLQCFLIIIFWNILQTRICALIFATISFFYIIIFDYIVMSEVINSNKLKKSVKYPTLFSDVLMFTIMNGYQVVEMIQGDNKIYIKNDVLLETLLGTITNMILIILQIVRWKFLFSLDELSVDINLHSNDI